MFRMGLPLFLYIFYICMFPIFHPLLILYICNVTTVTTVNSERLGWVLNPLLLTCSEKSCTQAVQLQLHRVYCHNQRTAHVHCIYSVTWEHFLALITSSKSRSIYCWIRKYSVFYATYYSIQFRSEGVNHWFFQIYLIWASLLYCDYWGNYHALSY